MSALSQAGKIEKNLAQLKFDLSKISEERWRAALSRDPNKLMSARMKAAEKTLENCRALAEYVENFSTPLARQITQRETEARRTFDNVRRTNDPKQLHAWIKQQLIPSTRFAERLGHMAASASMSKERSTDFHRWTFKR
jgi:vacuolar-type H+-ATPase subunit I/STV1